MAECNKIPSSLENHNDDVIPTNFNLSNTQINSQTVYVTYNNQYGLPQPPSDSYVLPVSILNNDSNFLFYNNPIDSDIDQIHNNIKDPPVPQYIVNLDGSSKPNIISTSGGINTVSMQNVDRLVEMYNRFPLLNKLIVKRIYTRNLLSIDKALYELDKLHKVEETKRKNIVLVCKKPKQEITPIFRTKGDNNLKSLVLTKKPFERMSTSLYKKVMIHNNNVFDCEKEVENGVVEDFIKSRCKAFVSDEINGVIQEDPKGVAMRAEQSQYKTKTERVTAGPEAGSIYPWRNKFDEEKILSDIEDNKGESCDYDFPICLPLAQTTLSDCSVNNNGFLNDLCTSEKINLNNGVKQITKSEMLSEEPRFFRTKRLGDIELKKRTYVTKELNQLRADKRVSLNSLRNSDSPIKRKKKKTEESDEEDEEEILKNIKKDVFEESQRRLLAAPIIKSKYKNILTNEEKAAFLHFFNGASISELSLMPGCSVKKSEEIVSLRPFTCMKDLNQKIQESNILTDNLIESCQEVINMRNMLSKLLAKCEKIATGIDKIIGKHLDNNKLELPQREEEGERLIFQRPLSMNSKLELKSYQLVGINWLNMLHKEKLNGILADEMGLGKTVQTIAFLCHLFDHGERGPHLIIVPSSTISSWERELSTWSPQLKVAVYHGSQEERKQMRMKMYERRSDETEQLFNVLLTTYNISTGTMEDRAMMKRINFHYGVFDEAHMLKNMLSSRYRNLVNFKVKRRLLLTGTPLQNNLLELISLLSFVMPELFLPHMDFLKKIFQAPKKDEQSGNSVEMSEFDHQKVLQTKDLLKPFCLRRSKEQVLCQLTPKTTEIIYLPLLESQKIAYNNIINDMRKNINNNGEKSPQSHLGTVMNLRKVSNHPLLMRNLYTDDQLRSISHDLLQDKSHELANPDTIFEDLSCMNDFQIHITCQLYSHVIGQYQLKDELLVQSNKCLYLSEQLPQLIKDGHKIVIFSQFVMVLDVLEAFLNLQHYSYLRLDGQTPVCDRQSLIDSFNGDDSLKIFLVSKKAGGLGINLCGGDVVILYDIDFNPFNDRQAEDRCHRLGQTKDVRVIKLISKDTIEEEILSIANDKLKLDMSTSCSGHNNSVRGGVDNTLCEEESAEEGAVLSPQRKVCGAGGRVKRVQFEVSSEHLGGGDIVREGGEEEASLSDIALLLISSNTNNNNNTLV